MTKRTLLGVAAILSTAIATPVPAQAVLEKPGTYALLSFQRGFRDRIIYTISATRSGCWPRNGQRYGISTVFPSIDGRKRNYNQTLVSAGRPPPAACRRCPHIDVSL
jgi:hypothetical protein